MKKLFTSYVISQLVSTRNFMCESQSAGVRNLQHKKTQRPPPLWRCTDLLWENAIMSHIHECQCIWDLHLHFHPNSAFLMADVTLVPPLVLSNMLHPALFICKYSSSTCPPKGAEVSLEGLLPLLLQFTVLQFQCFIPHCSVLFFNQKVGFS